MTSDCVCVYLVVCLRMYLGYLCLWCLQIVYLCFKPLCVCTHIMCVYLYNV